MRFIPPAGTPLGIKELASWLLTSLSDKNILDHFALAVRGKMDISHCFFLSSGRAALALITKVLYQLRNEPARNEVIMPAYTCYSVPGSIIRAGLKVRICDVEPVTLGYNLDALRQADFTNVLAIVSGNLYGIPNQLTEIEAIARDKGVYFIDDAAQSLGAKCDDRYAGTFGDIGLYSLDKGKNITSLQGAIIVTNQEAIAQNLGKAIESLPQTPTGAVIGYVIKTLIYSLFLRPHCYWIPKNLPFLGLGQTIFTTEYPVTQFAPGLAALGFTLFMKESDINGRRTMNGNLIRKAIAKNSQIELIQVPENIAPVYLRLPILVGLPNRRTELISRMEKAGIGASISYPESIAKLAEIHHDVVNRNEAMPGGCKVAESIVTLPTHPYVTGWDISNMTGVLHGFAKDQET